MNSGADSEGKSKQEKKGSRKKNLERLRSRRRLRVVSNFGESGEIHARARKRLPLGDAPREEAPKIRRLPSWRVSSREPFFARARVFRRNPQNQRLLAVYSRRFFSDLFFLFRPLRVSPAPAFCHLGLRG